MIVMRYIFQQIKEGLKYLSLNKNKTVIIDTPKLNISFLSSHIELIKLFYLTFTIISLFKKKKKLIKYFL